MVQRCKSYPHINDCSVGRRRAPLKSSINVVSTCASQNLGMARSTYHFKLLDDYNAVDTMIPEIILLIDIGALLFGFTAKLRRQRDFLFALYSWRLVHPDRVTALSRMIVSTELVLSLTSVAMLMCRVEQGVLWATAFFVTFFSAGVGIQLVVRRWAPGAPCGCFPSRTRTGSRSLLLTSSLLGVSCWSLMLQL